MTRRIRVWRLGTFGFSTVFPHFLVYIVDCGFGADEALEVGFDEDFEGGGFLLDGGGEEVEAAEEVVG